MPYATHEVPFIGSEQYSIDMDLCELLQTMKLDHAYSDPRKSTEVQNFVAPPIVSVRDELMSEDPSYHSDSASESSSHEPSSNTKELYGCAYLRTIQAQMQDYPTTGGEYLDAIFTHREILFSYPPAHHDCARAFTDIAYLLETRAWRADREADTEAVTAFRHEAWTIASSLWVGPSITHAPSKIC
ncbi:hypothetical protein CVT26_015668 [Gymnopilus dilepis]|uniref:Uncharacterized protein n=1 Tax=Gymnopilus dilepis TaxID=231916 RepID=A0A409VFB4_9AGAR|nr:hypothetical protein CVT26_015668 [Gymnopilus dilepis]